MMHCNLSLLIKVGHIRPSYHSDGNFLASVSRALTYMFFSKQLRFYLFIQHYHVSCTTLVHHIYSSADHLLANGTCNRDN